MTDPGPDDLAPRSDRPIVETREGVPAWLVAFLVVAAVAVVFVLQNRDRTEIDFLVFEVRSRTWTAIVTAMVLGVVLDRLFLHWRKTRRSAK